MAQLRGHRVRNPRVGGLVQQSPASGAHRLHPAGRSRGTLLRHAEQLSHGRVHSNKMASGEAGAVQVHLQAEDIEPPQECRTSRRSGAALLSAGLISPHTKPPVDRRGALKSPGGVDERAQIVADAMRGRTWRAYCRASWNDRRRGCRSSPRPASPEMSGDGAIVDGLVHRDANKPCCRCGSPY